MPKRKTFGRPRCKKEGTKNAVKAAERDELAARAAAAADKLADDAAAEQQAAAELSEDDDEELAPTVPRRTSVEEEQRREQIVRHFEHLLSPPEEMWDGEGGTVARIAKLMGMKRGQDRRPLRRTLQRHVDGKPLASHGGGPEPSLTHGEALVVADCFERGFSQEQAAYTVSAHREKRGKPPVGRAAAQAAFERLGGIERARGTRQQGSRADPDSAWSKSRKAMAGQFVSQLKTSNVAAERNRRDGKKKAPKVQLEQIGWSDETHVDLTPGTNARTTEKVVPRSPKTGKYLSVEDGGVYPEPDAKLVVKHPHDGGRMLMGVAMVRDASGGLCGKRISEPFDYTGTIVVGMKRFTERWDAEIARVAKLEGQWGSYRKTGATKKLPGGRWQLRYGDAWEEHVRDACKKTRTSPSLQPLTCVTELMDHIVAGFNALFADTP